MRSSTESYNYPTFKYKHYDFDRFTKDGPQIGEEAPDFTVVDLDGNKVSLSDFKGKTIILESGSITCPMYIRNIDSMIEMRKNYPDMEFLVLYVREAHPGAKIKEHQSLQDKLELAKRNAEEENDQRTFLIDNIEGKAHELYGLLPNFIYVIDKQFNIIYKADWAISKKLKELLEQISTENKVLELPKPTLIPPSPKTFYSVFKRAGWKSAYDFFIKSNIRIPLTLIKLKRKWRKQQKAGVYS